MGLIPCACSGADGIVVAVSGEVDVCTEGPLQLALLRIMRERGARLLLDVSDVSFMDCAGLRALLTTRRRAELRGGFMRLVVTSAAVHRIIELTGAREALAMERDATTPCNCVNRASCARRSASWTSNRVDVAGIALEYDGPRRRASYE
jgi:anti-anti-sigma factor